MADNGRVTPAGPDPAQRWTRRRSDESMSLLVDIQTERLDMAYVEAAARRAGRPVRGEPRRAGWQGPDRRRAADRRSPADRRLAPDSERGVVDERDSEQRRTGERRVQRPGLRSLRSAVLLALIGLLIGTAAAQLRGRQATETGMRPALLEEVAQRTGQSDRLLAEAVRLRAVVAAARDAALGADEDARRSADRLAALELVTGTVPVEGPGLVVRVDDAAGPGRGQPVPEAGRVLDRDVQDLANGLWAAGAEAVSVNGVRLTGRTAIRSAGGVVLVDYRPLRPPYVLEAVGDPGRLETDFVDGPTGRRFATYRTLQQLLFEVRAAERLRLAGAARGLPAGGPNAAG